MPRQMGKSEDYRRFARACLELARTTEDAQTRALMLQMAQIWQRLAQDRARDEDKDGEE
jgi:hypothetical protein